MLLTFGTRSLCRSTWFLFVLLFLNFVIFYVFFGFRVFPLLSVDISSLTLRRTHVFT